MPKRPSHNATTVAVPGCGTSQAPTAAEALLLVRSWGDLKDSRRRDLANALNGLIALAGLPAEAIRLDPEHSLALMDRASPNALGVAPSTLANRHACLRFIFRRLGLLAPRRVRAPEVSNPAWASLLERLPKGPRFARLKALLAYCVAEGIPPAGVQPATLDSFAEVVRLERGGAKARDHARRVGIQWNQAVREIEGWPAVRLGLRAKANHTSLPFSAYPESLQREIEFYLSSIGAGANADLFPELGQPVRRPVAASTVTTRMYSLRRLLWGAVQSGTSVEQLTSLQQVTSPIFIMASLRWHHQRAGEVNDDLAQLAATVASVANHLDIGDVAWAAIKPLLKRATPPPREGLTERNEAVLQALDDHITRSKLIHLPAFLMKKAARMRDGWTDHRGQHHQPNPLNAAWLASAAAAIEVLLHVPMRIRNLQELRIGQELRLTSVGLRRWRGELTISYVKIKNKVPLSMPLGDETIALLRDYLENFRGSLANASTTWLFPGEASPDRPRDKQAFGQAISEVIQDYVGVRVNPHAFRAFAGSVILAANPHAIDDVRAILGHRSFETAMIYYRRHNQRAAAERLSTALAGQRRKTKTLALSQLMLPEMRRRRRQLG